MFKNDLIFLVEDTEGNKFGEYLHEKITKFSISVEDRNAFMFTLQNDGRINQGNGMMKFESKGRYGGLKNQSDHKNNQ